MAEIPLFPLKTVLFPGGLLPLRIFEARYVDMVGRCMRESSVFGVVLIVAGTEVSSDVRIESVGTSCRIVDFQSLEGGLLGLLCRGEQRFRLQSRRSEDDGLQVGDIEWLAMPPVTPVAAELAPLVPVLKRVMASLGPMGAHLQPNYEDAGWVSDRFAELLPLELSLQQRLLEMDDPNERLGVIAPMINIEN
jgi:Lon protease-like protein